MNQIAQALRRNGYKGSLSDREAVKAFIAAENMEFQDAAGKAMDMEAVLDAATKKVTVRADAGEDVELIADDMPEAEGMMPEDEPKSAKPKAKTIEKIVAAPFRAEVADRLNAKSAYRNRAKRFGVGGKDNQVAFGDADTAEAFGAWFRSTMTKGRSYPQRANDLEIMRKAGLTTDLSLGGSFVPDEFRPDLIEIFLEYGAARQVAGVSPMSQNKVTWPRLTSDVTASWRTEGTTDMTASDIGTDQVSLIASELYAFYRLSNEFLQDSAVEVSSLIARSMARAIAAKEDQAYFNGDGTSTYGGFTGIIGKLTSIGTNPEDAAGLQLASGDIWEEIDGKDIEAMIGKLYEFGGLSNVVGVCHSKFYHTVLVPLMDRSEVAAANVNLSQAATAGAPPRTFRGIPIVFSNVMQTSATGTSARDTVPFLVGDFSLATKFGEVRGSLQVDSSEHLGFASNTTYIRAINRVAINVHDVGDGTTPGPIVGLIMEGA